jgi:hypothetical protein
MPGYDILGFTYDRHGRSRPLINRFEPTHDREDRLLAVASDERVVVFVNSRDPHATLYCQILGPARKDWGVSDAGVGEVKCDAVIAGRENK